jgi:phosphoribosylamine--glycine ligase
LDQGPAAEFLPNPAVTVVLASEGYPTRPAPVREILGIDSAEAIDDVEVCYGGQTGRVASVVGLGQNFLEARTLAYEGIARIQLEGSHYRSDIALRVVS